MRDDPRQAEGRIDLALALQKIKPGFASRTNWTPGADLASAVIAVRR